MRARPVALTAARRAELERVRDRDPRPYLRERAGAVLKIAAGWSARRVAREGLARPRQAKTVHAWRAAYAAGGVAGLVQRARGHRGFPPCAGRGAGRADAPAA
jgi:hypothetical protein